MIFSFNLIIIIFFRIIQIGIMRKRDTLFILLLISPILFISFFFFKKNVGVWHKSLFKRTWYNIINVIIGGETTNREKRSFSFFFFMSGLFVFLFLINICGLNIFLNQRFIGKLSLSLLFISSVFWIRSYIPFLFLKKEKFTLFVIGEISFPVLSFLLSNIEILTHLFRPITLTARLWVNIWVGHLLIRSISTICIVSLMSGVSIVGIILILTIFGFFLFELGIISLQAFVFSYLIGVYWKENMHHSLIKF